MTVSAEHRELVRQAHEESRRERERRQRERLRRQRARSLLRKAVESGEIERPDRCDECGGEPDGKGAAGKVHGHHETYDQPYDVVWLCPTCHRNVHADIAGRVRRRREKRRALREYRRWRRTTRYPTCGDSGGWSSTAHRPCKVEVGEPGERCRHHPREDERPIILRGGPADPTVLESAA